jgi:hypothetical protein
VSQIHRFHLRLGYDALTACFLVISVGGCTAPLLPQYCSSFFFQAAGTPFKAPASFNFSLKFSKCRRRAVQKNASHSSRTLAVPRLNWHRSAIFQRQYNFSSATWDGLLVCARRGTGVPPRATGRWPAGLKDVTCSRTGARGASFSPSTVRKECPTATLRWLLISRNYFLADIFDTWCFSKISNFRKFIMSDNFFRGTALRNRAV